MQVEFDEARVKAEESFGAVGPLTMIKMQRLLIEFEPKLWDKFQELDKEGTTKLPRKQGECVKTDCNGPNVCAADLEYGR